MKKRIKKFIKILLMLNYICLIICRHHLFIVKSIVCILYFIYILFFLECIYQIYIKYIS